MSKVNLNLTGESLLSNTSDAVKVVMANGLAILMSVIAHVSKNGNKCAKIIFSDKLAPADETRGHHEYLSLSEGPRFIRVMRKLAYIVKHSKNEEAIAAFTALPNPIQVVNGEDGQPIVFQTNEELAGIRGKYGEDVTFAWAEDEANSRIAIKFVNPDAYVEAFINAMSMFKGTEYYLEVKLDDNGFQRLVSINEPKL